MEIFEEVKAWLEQRGVFAVDRCGQLPGSMGLFPIGLEEQRRWEDVLGNRKRLVRYLFLLRLVAPPGEAVARLLLQLQQEAPGAGITATGGKLVKVASDGLGIYDVRLSAEREEKI